MCNSGEGPKGKTMVSIIMCSHPLDKKRSDDLYQSEYEAAKKLTNVYLFDIFNIDGLRLPKVASEKLIYHGWMMPPTYYTKFYNKCKEFGYDLINNPAQYKACHYFDGWYPLLEGLTPKSLIVEIDEVRPMMDKIMQFMHENNCGLIIKDYVKSLKHLWNEACFIPREADALHVAKVISTFLKIKNDTNDLQGNLVARQYIDLKQIGTHPKSRMPIANEHRTFIVGNELLHTMKYWDPKSYSGDVPHSSFIEEIADRIYSKTGSNLFTVDVAQLTDGSWTCIEVGDGQVSALPDHEDRSRFFSELLRFA